MNYLVDTNILLRLPDRNHPQHPITSFSDQSSTRMLFYELSEEFATEKKKKMETQINCAVDCVDGCVLGDRCPHKEYAEEASKFIGDTSLDKMIEIAEIARMKKLTEPPKWVIPEDF